MEIVLVSRYSLDIEQYVEFKMLVVISPSKRLISSRWVTNWLNLGPNFEQNQPVFINFLKFESILAQIWEYFENRPFLCIL